MEKYAEFDYFHGMQEFLHDRDVVVKPIVQASLPNLHKIVDLIVSNPDVLNEDICNINNTHLKTIGRVQMKNIIESKREAIVKALASGLEEELHKIYTA